MPKRYFFIHLAIFAGVCGTFAIAGISSYHDPLSSPGLEARPSRHESKAPPDSPAQPFSAGVLALTATR